MPQEFFLTPPSLNFKICDVTMGLARKRGHIFAGTTFEFTQWAMRLGQPYIESRAILFRKHLEDRG